MNTNTDQFFQTLKDIIKKGDIKEAENLILSDELCAAALCEGNFESHIRNHHLFEEERGEVFTTLLNNFLKYQGELRFHLDETGLSTNKAVSCLLQINARPQ